MKKKIIVVEDHEIFRDFVRIVANRMGFEVVVTVDGIEGLAAFTANPDAALIISDMDMPRMKGDKLAEAVKNEKPHMPFLLMTGGKEPVGHRADKLLLKPFTALILRSTISDLIGKPEPAP